MSRTIKFRVWDGEKGKMFPVRELFWRNNPYEMVGNYWDFKDESDQYGAAVYFPHTDAQGKHENFVLMQFTGFTDRNGTDIYEGDIIRYLDNTGYGLVEKTVYIEDIRALPDFICSKWEEVIGNIYENPELLKEEPK